MLFHSHRSGGTLRNERSILPTFADCACGAWFGRSSAANLYARCPWQRCPRWRIRTKNSNK